MFSDLYQNAAWNASRCKNSVTFYRPAACVGFSGTFRMRLSHTLDNHAISTATVGLLKQNAMAAILLIIFSICGGCGNNEYSFGDRASRGGRHIGSRPVLSPDGKLVVFGTVADDELGGIAKRRIDDRNTEVLTNSQRYEGQPDFDPTGKLIAFVSEKDGLPAIHLMDVDGRNLQRVTNSKYADFNPVFSNDGTHIAFTRHMSDNPDFFNMQEVFIISVNGTQERRLTNNTHRDSALRFSKDDKFIYVATLSEEAGYSTGLSKVSLDDLSDERVLPKTIEEGEICDVLEEKEIVLYVSHGAKKYDYEVFRCDFNGQNAKQLTNLHGYIETVRLRFDSNLATFVSEAERDGVGIIYMLDILNEALTPLGPNTIK